MVVYQISRVCIALMYMQLKHMVYGEFHIHPYLFLDKNENDNAYSTPLRYEVCNVDHKIIIMWIDLCYNNFSHICVQRQHYPEHDTFCLSILFPWIVFWIFLVKLHHFCGAFFVRCSWNSLDKLTSYFWVPVWIWIYESNILDTGSWTVDINWYM